MATYLEDNNYFRHFLLTNQALIDAEMEKRGINPACRTCIVAQLVVGRAVAEEQLALSEQTAEEQGEEHVAGGMSPDDLRVMISEINEKVRDRAAHERAARNAGYYVDALAQSCDGPEPAGELYIYPHLPPDRLVCPNGFLLRQVGIPRIVE